MLLVFQPQPITVNTQHLRFPIDIVFIDSQLRVVNVARNIQPGMLVTEHSPVQYVLEVNATETAGIEAGELVGIAIHQSPMGIPADFIPQLLTLGLLSAFTGEMFGPSPGNPKGQCGAPQLPPWRQAVEEKLGPEGMSALEKLHKEYRELDHYQIKEAFPKLDLPPLKGFLDTLNWLGLEVTKESPIHVSAEEKMEELKRYFEELRGSGYFRDYEPERFRVLREALGEEKAKRLFEP